jgi:hypothetical protein
MNCPECHDYLQQRLDGTPPVDRTALDQHLADCPQCRQLHAAAHLLDEGLRLLGSPAPPGDFTRRIVAQVLTAQRTARFRRRILAGFALAASLLLATLAGYFWMTTQTPTSSTPPPVVEHKPGPKVKPPEPAPSVLEETRTAAVSLTTRLAGRTIEQARLFWKAAPSVIVPPVSSLPPVAEPLDPAAQTLREASQGVSAGLEPMTTSAWRAADMILRELTPMSSETVKQ